jgi:hypothetical protein
MDAQRRGDRKTMVCPRYSSCGFFDTDAARAMGVIAVIDRNRFCDHDPEDCARARVASVLGSEAVPADLLPHDVERADDLVFGRV